MDMARAAVATAFSLAAGFCGAAGGLAFGLPHRRDWRVMTGTEKHMVMAKAGWACVWGLLPAYACYHSACWIGRVVAFGGRAERRGAGEGEGEDAEELGLAGWVWANLTLRNAWDLWMLCEAVFLAVFLVKLGLSRLEPPPGKTGSGPAMAGPARDELLGRMLDSTPDHDKVFPGWFGDCPFDQIGRQDVAEWLAWALFECRVPAALEDGERQQLDGIIATIEDRWAHTFSAGSGGVVSRRLALDPVVAVHRPLCMYGMVGCARRHLQQSIGKAGLGWTWHPATTAIRLGYWHRPPTGATPVGASRPSVVCLHGVGLGGEPFVHSLSGGDPNPDCVLATADCHVFAPEVPQVAYRIWPGAALTAEQMVAALRAMLDKHTAGAAAGVGAPRGATGPVVGGAIFIAQSFGTAVLGWVLRQAPELVYAALFLDPIC
eukprot:SAG22_NODE_4012_length_1422_cov_1.663643_1_plen_432_part_01